MITLMLTLLSVSGAPAAQDSVEAFFSDFAQKRASISVLEARFVQQIVSPDNDTQLIGTLLYAAPRRILFRYSDPEAVHIFDTLRVYQYDPGLDQVQIYDLNDDPKAEALFLGFENNLEKLQEAYDVELFDPGDETRAAAGLLLRPKPTPTDAGEESADRHFFERVRLYLRPGDYLPIKIHIVNDADTNTVFLIDDYKVNPRIDPHDTQVFIPAGANIIRNDDQMEVAGENGVWLPETPVDLKAAGRNPENDHARSDRADRPAPVE